MEKYDPMFSEGLRLSKINEPIYSLVEEILRNVRDNFEFLYMHLNYEFER